MRDGIVKTHRLFPTIVYEFNYDKNEMVRRIVREDCMNSVVDGKANEVTNPFMVTEVYKKQEGEWKLASLSFTQLLN